MFYCLVKRGFCSKSFSCRNYIQAPLAQVAARPSAPAAYHDAPLQREITQIQRDYIHDESAAIKLIIELLEKNGALAPVPIKVQTVKAATATLLTSQQREKEAWISYKALDNALMLGTVGRHLAPFIKDAEDKEVKTWGCKGFSLREVDNLLRLAKECSSDPSAGLKLVLECIKGKDLKGKPLTRPQINNLLRDWDQGYNKEGASHDIAWPAVQYLYISRHCPFMQLNKTEHATLFKRLEDARKLHGQKRYDALLSIARDYTPWMPQNYNGCGWWSCDGDNGALKAIHKELVQARDALGKDAAAKTTLGRDFPTLYS